MHGDRPALSIVPGFFPERMAKQQREAAVGFKRLRRVFPDGDVVTRTDTGVRERAGFVGVCERAKETE